MFNTKVVLSICLLAATSACTTIPMETVKPVESARVTPLTTVSPALITPGVQSPLLCEGASVYRPLPAFAATNFSDQVLSNAGKFERVTKPFPSGNAAINALLPNISSEISVETLTGAAEIGPFAKANGKRERITIDFMKYRSEPVQDDKNDKIYLYSRVGAGMRLTINIVTTDASLGSGGLLAFAVSAKAGLTKGYITADIIGMDASDITLAMPFTSDISEGSIQQIIEALAVIKSRLHQTTTTLTPQFIARIDCLNPKPAT